MNSVSSSSPRQASHKPRRHDISHDAPSGTPHWVRWWLLLIMALVVAIIVVGGTTRLTNSGLSITEWAPIRGALPPLSDAAWAAEFEKYKLIPEFEAEHPDMDLSGFKFIYFWEWAHRLLGRFIGLIYALPFFVLLVRRKLPAGKAWMFWGILGLIGLQGVIGWWMVHSGLQDGMVSVSQYRLATHLGMAFFILGWLTWMFLLAGRGWTWPSGKGGLLARTLVGLTFLQILAGALVAGTNAGKIFNSWPLMEGGVAPSDYWAQSPLWRNIFENLGAIQFNHRMLAYIIVAVFVATVLRYWKIKSLRWPLAITGGLILYQVIIGIWTLLAVAPLSLALKHQFTASFLFMSIVWLCFKRREIR